MSTNPFLKKLRMDPPDLDSLPLTERERETVDTIHDAMRNWLDESVDRLVGRLRDDTEEHIGRVRDEFGALMTEELQWEGELEERVRRLEAFEIEYGSEKTASETRALMNDVAEHLSDRRKRWEQVRARLEDLARHEVLE